MTTLQPILYAEDERNDQFFMARAIVKAGIANPVRMVLDGKLAMAYLAGTAPYTNRTEDPLPCLVLLDLSMPGISGMDVLKWLKNEPGLSTLPVILLTSSNQDSDIHRAYLLGADGYLVKPDDPEELVRIMKGIKEYWLGATRPTGRFIDFAAVGNPPHR